MITNLKKREEALRSSADQIRVCSRCVMDETDPDIWFDENGVCSHCIEYDQKLASRVFSGEEGRKKLEAIIEKIKSKGRGKEYNCIVGVSGGVDSTYVVYLAKKIFGLSPLAVHFDNGWNSELAVSNIEKALNKLDVDLYTYVVDWEEFKDLQLSFLKASTPDMEIPTDHGIFALLIKTALRNKVKYILTGMNYASESAKVPAWAYGHSDWKYIKSVHRLFGSKKLKTFPHFSLPYLAYALGVRGIKFVSPLNYIDYDKSQAVKILQQELDWRPYGGKHHESVYTRFIQSYILPKKFNIDKRKAHLSDLIRSGSGGMTRDRALEELKNPPCEESLLKQDRAFVIKKLGLTDFEFEEIMRAKPKTFKDYPNNSDLVEKLKSFQLWLRKKNIMPK